MINIRLVELPFSRTLCEFIINRRQDVARMVLSRSKFRTTWDFNTMKAFTILFYSWLSYKNPLSINYFCFFAICRHQANICGINFIASARCSNTTALTAGKRTLAFFEISHFNETWKIELRLYVEENNDFLSAQAANGPSKLQILSFVLSGHIVSFVLPGHIASDSKLKRELAKWSCCLYKNDWKLNLRSFLI